MFKRLLSLALCLALVLSCALSAAESAAQSELDMRLASLCFVSQKDPHLQGKRFNYYNAKLSVRGCAPSCITNLMILSLNVADQDTADEVLDEMLHLLCGKQSPATSAINVKNMKEIAAPDEDRFPTLARLIGESGVTPVYTNDPLNAAQLLERLAPAMDGGSAALHFSRLTFNKNCTQLVLLCEGLAEAGYSDALVAVSYITGGTTSTGGPFYSGDGHYITLLFEPAFFLACGTFYLIDSLPRALAGEPYRNREYYSQYPFSHGGFAAKTFRDHYSATRLRNTVVRFDLNAEVLAGLNAMTGQDALAERVRLLKLITNYGEGVVMICLPAQAQESNNWRRITL